jgi:hypothetical protein
MQQLMWFSIPGGLLVTAAWLWRPSLVGEDPNEVLLAAIVVGAGFIANQVWRSIFERFFGYHDKKRAAFVRIQELLGLGARPNDPAEGAKWDANRDDHNTFHLNLYSDAIPSSFREHNRGSWHYYIGLRTSAWTSVSCALFLLFMTLANLCGSWAPFADSVQWRCLLGFIGFTALAVLLFWKSLLTKAGIDLLEVAIVTAYRQLFLNVGYHVSGAKTEGHDKTTCHICRGEVSD